MESSFLSSSARKSVQTFSRFNSLFNKSSQRLATGLKVNQASDDPISYFTAKTLNDRASDLTRVLDSVDTTLGSVKSAEAGIQSIEKLVQLAEAVAGSTTGTPADKSAQYNELLSQIDQVAGDASFLGTNLLGGDSPEISFNTDGSSSLTLSGADFSAAGLGLSSAPNGFASDADIATAQGELKAALGSLRGFSSRLSTQLSVAEIRSDFTAKLSDTLKSGASDLTLADPHEEGANLLALQTRKSLAAASFSIVQKSESNVLKLFS